MAITGHNQSKYRRTGRPKLPAQARMLTDWWEMEQAYKLYSRTREYTGVSLDRGVMVTDQSIIDRAIELAPYAEPELDTI